MCAADFCELLPRVVAAYGKQTVRVNEALHLIGMMLGGQNVSRRKSKIFCCPIDLGLTH
jgi:hypothetical protein